MPPVIRNRRQPWELTDDDVTAALARISERDVELAREASHVYETLTWGEGPGRIRRAEVQDWLWYRLPTKYLTDEAGYMGRMAESAAVLFDAVGLDAYAALCRDERTSMVHAAFDRSETEGFKAMREALDASGFEPAGDEPILPTGSCIRPTRQVNLPGTWRLPRGSWIASATSRHSPRPDT